MKKEGMATFIPNEKVDEILDFLNSIDTAIISPFTEYSDMVKAVFEITDRIRGILK